MGPFGPVIIKVAEYRKINSVSLKKSGGDYQLDQAKYHM